MADEYVALTTREQTSDGVVVNTHTFYVDKVAGASVRNGFFTVIYKDSSASVFNMQFVEHMHLSHYSVMQTLEENLLELTR